MKPKINQAIIHITYSCSHHCPMCYANANNKYEHPSVEQLYRIIDRLFSIGITDITLVGGDPAEYPDILKLVQYIKKYPIKISVLSNTLDFSPNNLSVLDYIDVYEGTIHHSEKTKHDMFCGCKGAYEKIINNFKFFSSNEKSIGLAINLIPFNYDVIYKLIKNVVNHNINVDHVVLQRIIQFGRAHGTDNYELSQEMVNSIMPQIAKAEKDFNLSIIFEDPLPICAVDKEYKKYMHPCDWGITKISVDYNGKLARCGADIYHSFGSVFDDDFFEKWNNSEELTAFRNKTHLPQKCIKCKDYYYCGGGCPISRNPENGFSLDYLAR